MLAALIAGAAASAAAEDQDYPLPPPPPGRHADYSADKAEFDAEHSSLHLSGHVVLKESTMTVKGADLWIDTQRRTGRSDGELLVEDGVSAVYGESGEFDFGNHTGRLYHTSAGMADWRIHAREADLSQSKLLLYRDADFTSCNAVPPDYHFHASKVTVVPKQSMFARNVFFYLGDVPVFYTPVLYKSLSTVHRFGWKSQPGYDNRNGPFLRNSLLTQYSTSTYSKLFADYYAKQGFGYGAELERHHGEDSRGALFAYRIHETSSGLDRWTMQAQGFQALPSSSALQGRFQLQSDAQFNNAYARNSLFPVSPELRDAGAFVHRFQTGVARVSYARLDVQDPTDPAQLRFRKSTEDYPRLDYTSQPLRIPGLPWLNTFTGFADNNYDMTRPFLQRSVNGSWEATRTFVLARGVSFAPKASYSETYYSRFDELVSASSATYLDTAISRWTAAPDLRWNSPVGRLDALETYTQRLRPDAFSQDAGAADKGVESNLFSLSDFYLLPVSGAWAQLSSGYDFRTFRDHSVGFRDRVQPIVGQTNWRAGPKLTFSVRDDYQLQQGNRAVVTDARWGDEEGKLLGAGFAYNISDPSHYYANTEFALAPSSPTWRVDLILRGLVETSSGVSGVHGLRLFEKEITWTRRWHDFYTKLGFRSRPGGVGEVTARVDFKFGTTDPRQAPHRDWEKEWFPERENEDLLRP